MNAIRQTALLNKRELENAIPPSASWHVDYRDTAWVYIGGLPLDLSEGDVVTIFSQFGNPTHLNMIRDKETGKTKGFGFLKYEDQRSCDLAVDNLGGADVLGRMLRVDHTRYKRRDGEDEDTFRIERMEAEAMGRETRASDTEDEGDGEERGKKRRKMLKEEREFKRMLAITQDDADEDPLREYMIMEKKQEVERARNREEKKHKHKHRHHHRRKDEGDDDVDEKRHRYKHRRRSGSTAGDVEDDPRAKHKRNGAEEKRPANVFDRQRSRSRDRNSNDHKREHRRPRSSRSSSLDNRRQTKHRSRSPKRRSRYDASV